VSLYVEMEQIGACVVSADVERERLFDGGIDIKIGNEELLTTVHWFDDVVSVRTDNRASPIDEHSGERFQLSLEFVVFGEHAFLEILGCSQDERTTLEGIMPACNLMPLFTVGPRCDMDHFSLVMQDLTG
jgi:hypothetical protein